MINGMDKLIDTMLRISEEGIHSNDMTLGEIEEDMEFAIDELCRANGEPVPDWDKLMEEREAKRMAEA